MKIDAAALSDTGLQRAVNEDAVGVIPHRSHGARRDFLAVVADGMGGHGHGDVASRLAVASVVQAYAHAAADIGGALCAAVEQANTAVYLTAQQSAALRGMGTTCTAIAIRDGAVACAHVGDSRLYLIRGGGIYAMTEDHSAVRDLVARGLLTAEDARRHAERHVLSRAVGTAADVAVEGWPEPLPLRAGDRLLLSTDGLHGLVADEELRDIVDGMDAAAACRELIALARARGGHDNITAAVVHIDTSAGEGRQGERT